MLSPFTNDEVKSHLQVNNRDMSIAVLRTFISKRKEEHEAALSKRNKKALKVTKDNDSGLEAPSESPMPTGNPNGECEEIPHDGEEMPQVELCGTCKEPDKTPEGKGRKELKPPRVLEALSATGLRSLRYAREIEGIRQVVAVDNDKDIGWRVDWEAERSVKRN